MSKQFNVGDTVKYTSLDDGSTVLGVVKKVDNERFDYSNKKEAGYIINWNNGSISGWISGANLSLVDSGDEMSLDEAEELKAELESKILQLIQEFNKKTNLEVQDIDLDYYKAIDGKCFYQIAVKVEI